MPEFAQRERQTENSHLVSAARPDRATPQPAHAANPLLAQQQALGNQATQRFAESCPLALPSPSLCPFGGICHACPARVQAKLTVNKPGDKYEQEADRVADQVMRMPEPRLRRQVEPEEEEEEALQAKPLADQITPLVQRQVESEEEEEEEPIQTKLADDALLQRQEEEPGEEEEEPIQTKWASEQTLQAGSGLQAKIRSLKNGRRPLSQPMRNFFEPRYGCDFSQVRIHTDAQATESARTVNARAFTVGRDIVFGTGQYAPGTAEGRRLLAHELTHVVQQTGTQTSHPTVQMQEEMVPREFLPSVRSATGDFIVSQAENRMRNRFIRRAYSSEIPWFFSPNGRLALWASRDDILEAARRRGSVGGAEPWMKRRMVRRKDGIPALGRELENFPSGEGVVWWGKGKKRKQARPVWTCNVFVFDVLHQAGLNPPLRSNNHYFTPVEIFNRAGSLRSYFSKVKAKNMQKGDVFATHVHTAVVTSTLSKRTIRRGRRRVTVRSFSAIGAGQNGIGVAKSDNVRPAGKRFRRVGSKVLETHTAIA